MKIADDKLLDEINSVMGIIGIKLDVKEYFVAELERGETAQNEYKNDDGKRYAVFPRSKMTKFFMKRYVK